MAAAIDLTIAYAAAFGGMSTLTGTAANLALQGTLQSEFGADSTGTISYLSWLIITGPLCLFLLLILWILMILCFTRFDVLMRFVSIVNKAFYCCFVRRTKKSTPVPSESTTSTPIVRNIIDTSLFQYSNQRFHGNRTPKSGYKKQVNKEDDWDVEQNPNDLSIELPSSKLEISIDEGSHPQSSPLVTPDNAESDDFLYSESINFGANNDYANGNRRSIRKQSKDLNVRKNRATTSSLLLAEDEEEDDEEYNKNELADGDDGRGTTALEREDEFTTIMFAAPNNEEHTSPHGKGKGKRNGRFIDLFGFNEPRQRDSRIDSPKEDPLSAALQLDSLGYAEGVVLITFCAMALLWVTRDPPGVDLT